MLCPFLLLCFMLLQIVEDLDYTVSRKLVRATSQKVGVKLTNGHALCFVVFPWHWDLPVLFCSKMPPTIDSDFAYIKMGKSICTSLGPTLLCKYIK